MSDSKSLKTDKELMWGKLSTPYDPDEAQYQRLMARFMAGWRSGEIGFVDAFPEGTGKSVYMDIETNSK